MLGKPALGWTGEAAVTTGVNRLGLDFSGDLMLGFDVSGKRRLSICLVVAHLATETFFLARALLDMILMAIVRNMLQTMQTLLHLM